MPGSGSRRSITNRIESACAVMLSGDAVHFRYSLEKRYIPSNNVDRDQTLASYRRIEELLAQHKAQLWANHDKEQHAALKKSPEYYE